MDEHERPPLALDSERSSAGTPARPPRLVSPIFLPHFGCPFRCVYCSQECVASRAQGGARSPDPLRSFRAQLQTLTETAPRHAEPGEVALYGGTFTGLAASTIVAILDTLARCVGEGVFSGVRFSTRPDGLSEAMCDLLRGYPISTVELGVQSFSDTVLRLSERGYDSRKVVEAAERARGEGWGLGIQLMAGLPGDSVARFQETITRTAAMKPDLVRLYPTLVLKGTRLASWHVEGRYSPLSLEEAVDRAARAYDTFLRAGIPVGRMGLHADRELVRPGNIVAGPFHPAFGYLVRVRWWRDRVSGEIGEALAGGEGRRLTLHVPDRFLSEVLGPGRENLEYWKHRGRFAAVRVLGEKEWPRERLAWEIEPD